MVQTVSVNQFESAEVGQAGPGPGMEICGVVGGMLSLGIARVDLLETLFLGRRLPRSRLRFAPGRRGRMLCRGECALLACLIRDVGRGLCGRFRRIGGIFRGCGGGLVSSGGL